MQDKRTHTRTNTQTHSHTVPCRNERGDGAHGTAGLRQLLVLERHRIRVVVVVDVFAFNLLLAAGFGRQLLGRSRTAVCC